MIFTLLAEINATLVNVPTTRTWYDSDTRISDTSVSPHPVLLIEVPENGMVIHWDTASIVTSEFLPLTRERRELVIP